MSIKPQKQAKPKKSRVTGFPSNEELAKLPLNPLIQTVESVDTVHLPVNTPKSQELHLFGSKAIEYESGLKGLLNANKRIIALTTTYQHLVVITEG